MLHAVWMVLIHKAAGPELRKLCEALLEVALAGAVPYGRRRARGPTAALWPTANDIAI